MRPLALANPSSGTIRRVWKFSTISSKAIQNVALRRAYATTVQKTRGKPAASATKAKPAAKKPAAKKTPVVKKKLAVKKKPAVKKKLAKKPAKLLPKKRKGLTEKQKELKAKKAVIAKLADVKRIALLKEEPKKLSTSAWILFANEYRKTAENSSNVIETTRNAGLQWKALSAAGKEPFEKAAKLNAEANELSFKNWVSTYTPDQIRKANNARHSLRRRERAARIVDGKGKGVRKFQPIQDNRQPKPSHSAYNIFTEARWATGEFKGRDVVDVSTQLAKEFKSLGPAEKMVYDEKARLDRERYKQESETVFQ